MVIETNAVTNNEKRRHIDIGIKNIENSKYVFVSSGDNLFCLLCQTVIPTE